MTDRLTFIEATAFLETVLDVSLDSIATGHVEAFAFDLTTDQVQADMESYLATLDRLIDPASIEVRHTILDEAANTPCVHIIIKTRMQ